MVAAGLLALILTPRPAMAARANEESFVEMVNTARLVVGSGELTLSDRLCEVARRHSRRMASQGQLFHSDLGRLLRGGAQRVGENVGVGRDLSGLLDAFLDSPDHRENLLGHWESTGVGVVRKGGRLWITQVFRA